jgi:hypothetical protein
MLSRKKFNWHALASSKKALEASIKVGIHHYFPPFLDLFVIGEVLARIRNIGKNSNISSAIFLSNLRSQEPI